MSKKNYYLFVTIVFGFLAIPTIINVIFETRFLNDLLDKTFVKMLLILFIGLAEANYIKNKWGSILGFFLVLVLLAGILMKIIHWQWGSEIVGISALLMFVNFVVFAILERNRNVLHILLFTFFLIRVVTILFQIPEIFWWIDLGVCLLITLTGIWYLFKGRRNLFVETP